jgi:hypothetical protein
MFDYILSIYFVILCNTTGMSDLKVTRVIVCFLLGNFLASEFYMPTFWNTLCVPSSWAGRCEG